MEGSSCLPAQCSCHRVYVGGFRACYATAALAAAAEPAAGLPSPLCPSEHPARPLRRTAEPAASVMHCTSRRRMPTQVRIVDLPPQLTAGM